MNPFDFFDKIYVINLDYRKDRLAQVMDEFSKVGIKDRVERHSGLTAHRFGDPKKDACYGNHLAHSICIHNANIEDANNVLIFEDDVQFLSNAIEVLSGTIQQIPKDWDMLYLGVNIEKPAYQISRNLAKLTFAYSTHAYAVNLRYSSVKDDLLSINTDPDVVHNDVEYSNKIIPNYNCYSCVPIIAIQRPSYSDIEKKFMDYDWMQTRFEQNLVRR